MISKRKETAPSQGHTSYSVNLDTWSCSAHLFFANHQGEVNLVV